MTVILAGMAAAIFILDVLIKQSIEEQMDEGEERTALKEKIVVRKVYNKGMALNFLDRYPKAVALISGVLGILMAVYDAFLLLRKGHHIEKTGMMLFTGGALSNIFDRLVRGKVIDYFGFRTKWERFNKVTFNLGDLFIVIGAGIAAVGRILRK